jgi:polysaccharide deacetylase family protein (PEP-CTERM system associated)
MKFLTFDIEDWFHILDNPETKYPSQWESFPKRIDIGLDIILNLCAKHEIKATFFCLGWIAEKYPEQIKKIQKAGHEIGTHGYAHQLVYEQTEGEFRQDLIKSINLLKSITGQEITAYRAPGFSITKECLWAFDVLSECGIIYDSSVFPASRAHGGLKEITELKPYKLKTLKGNTLIEFPISARTVFNRPIIFGGGGYFRLIPIYMLRKWFTQSEYVMTYFHPRDFDNNQPSIPGLNSFRKFKAFFGINSAKRKLDTIIASNSFSSSLKEVKPTNSFYLQDIH